MNPALWRCEILETKTIQKKRELPYTEERETLNGMSKGAQGICRAVLLNRLFERYELMIVSNFDVDTSLSSVSHVRPKTKTQSPCYRSREQQAPKTQRQKMPPEATPSEHSTKSHEYNSRRKFIQAKMVCLFSTSRTEDQSTQF